MQRLVSPDLNVYTISDLEALSELVAGLRLDSTLASNLNLREVLSLQTVGNGSRQGRQMPGNWPRLHIVVRAAPAHALVPVVGSNAIRIFKRLTNVAVHRLQTRADMNF